MYPRILLEDRQKYTQSSNITHYLAKHVQKVNHRLRDLKSYSQQIPNSFISRQHSVQFKSKHYKAKKNADKHLPNYGARPVRK